MSVSQLCFYPNGSHNAKWHYRLDEEKKIIKMNIMSSKMPTDQHNYVASMPMYQDTTYLFRVNFDSEKGYFELKHYQYKYFPGDTKPFFIFVQYIPDESNRIRFTKYEDAVSLFRSTIKRLI